MDKAVITIQYEIPESELLKLESRIEQTIERFFSTKAREIQNERINYTRKEAIGILKCSYPSLDKHIANGKIKCTRIGRKVLIPQDQLDQFLNNQK
jgi:excisionase family DNA binding protein